MHMRNCSGETKLLMHKQRNIIENGAELTSIFKNGNKVLQKNLLFYQVTSHDQIAHYEVL